MTIIGGPWLNRQNHKWAMVGYKGGKCLKCFTRVTPSELEKFDFDHKEQINDPHNKTDRWSGAVRDWPPFTDKWFAWADKVDLICQKCHREKHGGNKQLSIDWECQKRLDEACAAR